jgi:hypothetical protein
VSICEVVIYPCINNSYELIEHSKVEKVLKSNSTKGWGKRHGFTQFKRELKSKWNFHHNNQIRGKAVEREQATV